eukprot:4387269-Pyramimonas_sp.AAC.1
MEEEEYVWLKRAPALSASALCFVLHATGFQPSSCSASIKHKTGTVELESGAVGRIGDGPLSLTHPSTSESPTTQFSQPCLVSGSALHKLITST